MRDSRLSMGRAGQPGVGLNVLMRVQAHHGQNTCFQLHVRAVCELRVPLLRREWTAVAEFRRSRATLCRLELFELHLVVQRLSEHVIRGLPVAVPCLTGLEPVSDGLSSGCSRIPSLLAVLTSGSSYCQLLQFLSVIAGLLLRLGRQIVCTSAVSFTHSAPLSLHRHRFECTHLHLRLLPSGKCLKATLELRSNRSVVVAGKDPLRGGLSCANSYKLRQRLMRSLSTDGFSPLTGKSTILVCTALGHATIRASQLCGCFLH